MEGAADVYYPIDMTEEYYRHFKGNIYRILHIAKHSETLEDIVVYQAMYGERSIWVRPKAIVSPLFPLRKQKPLSMKNSGQEDNHIGLQCSEREGFL